MRYNLIHILLFLFALPNLYSENITNAAFTYQYLTTKEGLSSQRVFSIETDPDGFIWIGTRAGIDCYNGREIKKYQLFSDDIIADDLGRNIYLTKSSKSEIWAYTNSGKIFKYNPDNDSFVLELDLRDRFADNLQLNQLQIDSEDNLWIALKNGLFFHKTQQKNSTFKQIISNKSINSLHYSQSSNSLYVSCIDGLYELSLQNNPNNKVHLLLKDVNVQTTFYDEETSFLWIGTFHLGMKLFDTRTHKLIENPNIANLPQLPYRSISVYDEKTLLLGVDGAGVYYAARKSFSNGVFLDAGKENKGPLNGNGVYAINKDKEGNLWIGTYTGGVTLANPKNLSFDLIQHENNNNQSLINNHVNAILEDKDGDIWYGTSQGVSVYFTREKTWKHYLSNQVVLTLCEDEGQKVWAGGYGFGLYAINKHKGIVRHLSTANPQTLTTDYIYSIFKDSDKSLWIGGTSGKLVNLISSNGAKPDSFRYYEIDLINSITDKNKDTLAIATVNGFYLLDKHSGHFMHYFSSPEASGTRSNSFIYSMYFESPETIWFGTDGGGLNRFDTRTLKAATYSTANGLPSNYIYAIIPDNKNRLWMSTDKGLATLDLKESKITNMGLVEKVDEFNFMAFTSLRDGSLMFGSTSGAIRFKPEEINFKQYEAPLFFTSLEYSTKSGYKKFQRNTLNKKGTIDLKYNENTFLFSFISVSFQHQKDILYTYMLEGFDNEWSKETTDLSVRYTNVPPGKYIFKIKSLSKVGRHELDERSITINISQPFWNTIGAWILYALILMGISYFIWRFFTEKMEKRYFSEKVGFFINTAHDIRTPVTLIMAPLNDLVKEEGLSPDGVKYLAIARKNTDKLFKLITQLLDFEKSEVDKSPLHVSEHELNDYLSEKVEVFSPLCTNKKIQLSISSNQNEILAWFDKDKMDKIMDNLISNAIKYSPESGGEINIILKETDKKIIIEICDNGIGIPKSAQKHIFSNFYRAQNAINSTVIGSGIGLLLTRKLVKLHRGKIFFESTEGKGSVFHLTLRKGNDHFPTHSLVDSSTKTSVQNQEIIVDLSSEGNFSARRSSSKPTLMIVEDNDELRFYLKKSFEKDYNVIVKSDGESALSFFKNNFVDIIVSDIMMPGMQGDELCYKLKTNIATSHIPIILLTAKAEKSSVIGGLQSGADDYLTKPFDVDILRIKLSNILRSRQVMREYFSKQSTERDADESQQNIEIEGQLTAIDKEFLERCINLIDENLSNSEFNITILCRELAVSRTVLYEKLKSLTGQAPNDLIRFARMKEAAKLLKEGIAVQEVSERIGLSDSKYFSTAFKKHFGVSPSKFK